MTQGALLLDCAERGSGRAMGCEHSPTCPNPARLGTESPGCGRRAQAAGLGYQGKAGGSPRGTHQAILMGADAVILALLPINIWVSVCPAAQHARCRGESKGHKR